MLILATRLEIRPARLKICASRPRPASLPEQLREEITKISGFCLRISPPSPRTEIRLPVGRRPEILTGLITLADLIIGGAFLRIG